MAMDESWITPETVGYLIITSLGIIAWRMIVRWARSWETKLIKQDRRLDLHGDRINEHDIKFGKVETKLENIDQGVSEIKTDVKRLLISNGGPSRSSG